MDLICTTSLIAAICLIVGGLLFISWRINSLEKRELLQHNFSQQLLTAQEEERKRIAVELQDRVGQELLVLKARLEVMGMKHDISQTDVDVLSGQMITTIERTRKLSHELRPPHIERFGLPSSLITLAQQISENTGIPITTQIEEGSLGISADMEITLFRIAQEALNNIVEHSDAGEAILSLKKTANYIALNIKDDGRGFNPQETMLNNGQGLKMMEERARLIGANLTYTSKEGKGTQITVEVEKRCS